MYSVVTTSLTIMHTQRRSGVKSIFEFVTEEVKYLT